MKQISVFLENKPGSLNEMAEVLANNGVNMRAISLAEAEGFGIVRIIADDIYKATTVLKEAGFVHNLVDMVGVEIPDEPGGLLKVLNVLREDDINLDYMYAFNQGADVCFALKVADQKKAKAALRGKGIKVIEQEA